MSFYQTTNASIVRFRTVPRKTVAPFASLQRVVKIQNIGDGYANTGLAFAATAQITPEQLQNGALIIAPSTSGLYYALPSAYAIQEYFGGRLAFNMAANQVNIGAGANQMTGPQDFFLINVYNLGVDTATFVNGNTPASDVKVIQGGFGLNDAKLTPLLLRFDKVNSPYATINGVANAVNYTIY